MKISIIAAYALDKDGRKVIGTQREGEACLPWQIFKEMGHFKRTTMGHPVLTGHTNYLTIPEEYAPLEGRENIILSRKLKVAPAGTYLVDSIEKSIELLYELEEKEGYEKAYVIGGGKIYKQFLEQEILPVTELVLTKIDKQYQGNVFFPQICLDGWKPTILDIASGVDKISGEEVNYRITQYER